MIQLIYGRFLLIYYDFHFQWLDNLRSSPCSLPIPCPNLPYARPIMLQWILMLYYLPTLPKHLDRPMQHLEHLIHRGSAANPNLLFLLHDMEGYQQLIYSKRRPRVSGWNLLLMNGSFSWSRRSTNGTILTSLPGLGSVWHCDKIVLNKESALCSVGHSLVLWIYAQTNNTNPLEHFHHILPCPIPFRRYLDMELIGWWQVQCPAYTPHIYRIDQL